MSSYLKNYNALFSKPIDEVWDQADSDHNGYLDRNEAKQFLDEIVKIIDKDRAQNYKRENFDKLFEEYDDDKNGVLSKSEMAQFIKMNFKNSEDNIKKTEVKLDKVENSKEIIKNDTPKEN